jgi:glycosyltransferase involved in cell wall biosynthesis
METFGHPFVEAMCAGTPVIAADTGFARELCEQAAMYFAPGNPEDLARILDLVTRDVGLRQALSEKGRKRAGIFSWEREAAETLELMREVGATRIQGHCD